MPLSNVTTGIRFCLVGIACLHSTILQEITYQCLLRQLFNFVLNRDINCIHVRNDDALVGNRLENVLT
jgi:hypothetical protein